MSSRTQGYDGESRRSPRDRSPGRYNDPRDEYRGGAGRGNDRRGSTISDSRSNSNAFSTNRDTFRDSIGRDSSRDFASRDPPRGPKSSLIDAPTGPRSNSYSSDFRGDFGGYRGDFRGGRARGGRGGGRGWRDDSRDRGREPERDYRDRRDDRGPPREPFRDERGRDRDRWNDRESFRGRRTISPPGRGRSPNYGPRDIRDGLPPGDLDRARRGSRDGLSSASSPSADTVQPFVRGYGRARGTRGRGRGGFYEDYHRPPGRSRSPDPSWSRRTQPSATPPPQVPAFGSTNSTLPTGPTSISAPLSIPTEPASAIAPGIAIPTAPRALVPHTPTSRQPFGSRFSQPVTSKKWVRPPQSPSGNQQSDAPIPTPAKQSEENGPSMADNEWSKDSSVVASRRSPTIALDEGPPHSAPTAPTRKRRPIIGKRSPRPLVPDLHDATDEGSDSDSGEFGDEYFEDEIRKTEEEIARVSSTNVLIPRQQPPAVFLRPFMEANIDILIAAHQPVTTKECIPPMWTADVPPPPTTSLAPAPKLKGKGRSRPATPLPEPDGISKPNGKPHDSGTTAGPHDTNQSATRGQQHPSIIVPVTTDDTKGRDVPDQVLAVSDGNSAGPGSLHRKPLMEVPDEEQDEQTQEENRALLIAVRRQMTTPPVSSLPDFDCVPWHQDKRFKESLEVRDPLIEAKLKARLRAEKDQYFQEQEIERFRFKRHYFDYRTWTDFSNDPIAVRSREIFAKSRAQNAAEAAAPPPSIAQTASLKPEGQRRTGSRWATEHDLERVLRESEQEAKETKEREERVARAKTASAKEATIPDMCWNEEEWEKNVFIDRTHIVPFERSFAVLEFGEPIDNFTEEEAEIFEKVYLEFPKQWTKIAEALERRDYKACIQHYYVVKHDSCLKEKLKKQGRKRRGKQAKSLKPKSNSLISDLRDDAEDGQDNENGGERRRPRRAAAPTWPIEAPQSESEVASPAPTPGRKTAATPKGDASGEQAPPKKRAKGTREKSSAKQAKNNQLLAAAPLAGANRRDESPATPVPTTEWKTNQRPPVMATRFPPQYDGAGPPQQPTPTFAPPYVPLPERQLATMPMNVEIAHQPFPAQERVEPPPPINFDPQQERRNTTQTSSYWSVPETTDFPALLKHFGTDWHGIAKFMTSKTHIMVKNYYQRQVEAGKKEWEDSAHEADQKRSRGEPTGPLPQPTVIPKRRYEVSGSMPRAGSAPDGFDEHHSPGQAAALNQASPSQQPVASSRFPTLAQAGPVPHQAATFSSTLNRRLTPQPIQQALSQTSQQPRPSHGPTKGYFKSTERPALQNDHLSQRSLQAAQEAQLEQSTALRLAKEQRDQQHQRERIIQMKQENDTPNPHQFEPYSAPPVRTNNVMLQPQARPETVQPQPSNDHRQPLPNDSRQLAVNEPRQPLVSEVRRTAPPAPPPQQQRQQQYQPVSHQAVRNLLSDNVGGNREIKASPSPATARAPMSAPPQSHDPYSTPSQPPPQQVSQPTPLAPVRQPETVRKTSNLMALLNNDEPSDPRPAPTKRASDVSTSSLQQISQTPSAQHPLQPSRYSAHTSQPSSQPSQISHQMSHQPPMQHISQNQHQFPQSSHPSHPIHQHSSSSGHPRSFTPTGFETRSYGPHLVQQQQQQQQPQLFAHAPRQSINTQPTSLRREPSLGDVHGISTGYARSSAPSQSSMRLKESPYSASPVTTPQSGRPSAGSPLDTATPSDRDFYSRPQQYLMQQSSSATGSPQLGPSYHSVSQQQQGPPSHRHLTFSQAPSHTASPPTSIATQRPDQRSRQNSFDGRYQMPPTSGPNPSYGQAPQHQQPPPMSIRYQQQQQQQQYEREHERRLQEDRERHRRQQHDAVYPRR